MSLPGIWRERASLFPFSVACVWDDLSPLPLLWTYSQLTERTISLSCILRALLVPTALEGLRPFVIGLYAYNTPSTLAAILSILSLPAGYCPIRSGPPKRVWSQLQEGRVGVVLVQIHLIQEFINDHESWLIANNWKPSTLLIEYDFVVFFSPVGDWFSYQEETRSHTTCTGTKICLNCTKSIPSLTKSNQTSHLNLTPPKNSINNDGCGPESYPIVTGLAYLVHTTGTTGSPKGVWVPHCCIVPNVIDLCGRFDVREDDRVFNASPLTFDPSVVEIFLSLYSGATLLLVPPVIKSSPLLFSHVILRSRHVTLLQATPTLIRRLPSDVLREELLGAWSSLRVLAFGGETCPSVKTLREWKSSENKTRLFNIYGITEVSSWASCHEIDIHDSAYEKPHPLGVPIGEPLLGTQIELRGNEQKRVFIGGDYRVCCLGNEESLVQGTFRDSGDNGTTDEHGRMYLCGRSDRQIKRSGHRINLDYIEQVISSLDLVRLCCVVEGRGVSGVVAVVVPTVVMAVDRTRRLLFEEMRGCLCDNEIPDQILLVEEIPANIHGKIDINSISIPQSFPSSIDISSLTLQKWRDLILESVSIATGNVTMTTSKGIKLSELGVSSFELLRSVYQLEEHLSSFKDDHKESLLSQIFEIFLTRPLDEAIATTFKFVTLAPPPEASGYHGNSVVGVKRGLSEKEREGPIKRTRRLMNDLKWFRRGLMFDNGSFYDFVLPQTTPNDNLLSWKLVSDWVVPTGGCVDSSPLLVRYHGNRLAYVGSHSGLVLCVELMGGVIKWRKQLRGRVESSLCVSYCGEYVIAGSYDGCLYVLHSLTGSIHWCFTTKGSVSEDPIKSSPLAHPVTGYIWFGSHDHHLYTVDIYERRCVHAVHLGGGAIFSSVTFSRDVSLAIVATLQGKILCIEMNNGDIIWEYLCPRPVFSTPTVLPNDDIICGCVNGSLYILSNDGKLVTELATEGPVFTSPIVTVMTTLPTHSNEFLIFSGSHDKSMYCWKSRWSPEENKHTYDLKWKVALNGEIYSIGMLSKSHTIDTLCTCTAKGTIYILSPDSGRILTFHDLPNQIFSSPVFFESRILVGCRDDGLHCLSLVMAGE